MNVGNAATLQHANMLNQNMGAGGAPMPMSGVVPLAEPPPKKQKIGQIQVPSSPLQSELQLRFCSAEVRIASLLPCKKCLQGVPGQARTSGLQQLIGCPPSTKLQENAGTSLLEVFSLEEIQKHLQMLSLTSPNPAGGAGKGKNMFAEFADDRCVCTPLANPMPVSQCELTETAQHCPHQHAWAQQHRQGTRKSLFSSCAACARRARRTG